MSDLLLARRRTRRRPVARRASPRWSRVEEAWLRSSSLSGSPRRRSGPRGGWSDPTTSSWREAGEAGGNPVIPLVALLRAGSGVQRGRGPRVHRGLTSQDVVDTGADAVPSRRHRRVEDELRDQVEALADLADATGRR